MGIGRTWTQEEVTYLQDKWGSISIKSISENLGRTVNAVKLKAQRLGLGDARFESEYVSLNQLAVGLGVCYSKVKYWFNEYNLPAKRKIFCQKARVLVIKIDDFWEWAVDHKERLNLTKMEPLVLGPEPDWVKEKRKADILKQNKTHRWEDWTEQEDRQLIALVNAYRYTYPEISQMLNRSATAVKRRLYDLGVKARPVRLNNHIKWTQEETEQLIEMAVKGYGYNTIAEKLGKSELGVRGKLERMSFDFKHRKLPGQEVI